MEHAGIRDLVCSGSLNGPQLQSWAFAQIDMSWSAKPKLSGLSSSPPLLAEPFQMRSARGDISKFNRPDQATRPCRGWGVFLR